MAYIISPYEDLFKKEMNIPVNKKADFRYSYNVSQCTITSLTDNGIEYYQVINETSNQAELIRKSRTTVYIK